MLKTILVAGGAGYIGRHMVAYRHQQGYEVVVVDNPSILSLFLVILEGKFRKIVVDN